MKRLIFMGLVVCFAMALKSDDWQKKLLGKHPERVNSVSVSPDGQWVASASNDNKVMVWNTQTNELVKEIMCHAVGVTDVVFSKDHAVMITSGNDNLIRVWDTKTWKRTGEIAGHKGQVNDIVLTADDQFLYSCGDDMTIVKWKMEDRTKVKEIGSHSSRVLSINLGGNDKYLVSTSGDKMTKESGNLKIWDLEAGTCSFTFEEEQYAIQSACFNSTGSLVLFGGNFTDIYVLKRSTGSIFTSKEVTKYGVNSVAVKGTTVYAGTTFDGQIIEWPIGSDLVSFKAHDKDITKIALSGNDLISVGSDGKVLSWTKR